MKIQISRIDKNFPLPEYQTAGAAAFDIYTRVTETIAPGERKVLPTNLIIKVPEGFVLILANRSSTARKKGLQMPNGIGVVDQDFHGPEDEIGILLYNFTKESVTITAGDRIAQALMLPIEKVEFEEVEKIKEQSRGGFGSTGN